MLFACLLLSLDSRSGMQPWPTNATNMYLSLESIIETCKGYNKSVSPAHGLIISVLKTLIKIFEISWNLL